MKFWQRGEKVETVQGRFQSDSLSLAYDTIGEGEAVVFVHGFASSVATNWLTPGIMKAVAEEGFLAAGFDARGHAQSDHPSADGAYRLDAMTGDVERFIQFLGVERAHIVGYSMGARITLRLLTTRPQLVRSAVLGGVGEGVGTAYEKQGARIADALLAHDVGAIGDRIARRFRLFAESQGNDLRALAQCIQEAMEPIDLTTLKDVAQPVLVLAGAEDDQIANPEGLARRIPGARAEIIPNRNHMTIIGDARFKHAIVRFLVEQKL